MSRRLAKRKLVVDGERWRWSAARVPDWSEYTPALPGARYLTLQGPDGYRRTFEIDGKPALTPSFVADYVRKLTREGRWPGG